MTEKRWKIHEIKDRGWGLYDLIDTEKNRKYQFDVTDRGIRELVVTLLNELHEENKQLKQKNTMLNKDLKSITDRKNHLESEWDKFYELVDKKIKKLEDKYKFGRTEYSACPMHNIMFGINVLKELKKELEE